MNLVQSKIPEKAGLLTFLLGCLGVLAWLANVPILTSFGSDYVPSSPPAGVGHALLGLALYVQASSQAGGRNRLATFLSWAVVLLGVTGLLEAFVNENLGTSRLFYDETLTSSGHVAAQLSPISAIAFILMGASLLGLRSPSTRHQEISCGLVLMVLLIHFVVILGYLYGTPILYGGSIRPVSALSALASLVVPTGIIVLAGPERFPLRLVMGESVSARMLRVLLPATFLSVLLGQVISDMLRRESVANLAVQDALQTFVFSLVVTYIVLRSTQEIGKRLGESEAKRKAAEEELVLINRQLEERVKERTLRLQQLNEELQTEISSRTRVSEALRVSERRNKALLDAVPDWILRFSGDGVLTDHKSPRPEDSEASTAEARLLADLVAAASPHVVTALSGSAVFTTELQVYTAEKVLDFEMRMARSGGKEVFAILRDITDLKRVEEEVLSATMREQRRIGEELHDGLGQHLTGIAFMMKALQESLREKAPIEYEEAEMIGNAVARSIGQVRSISRGLFLTEMGSKGLLSALDEMSISVSTIFRVKCTVNCSLEDHHLANSTVNFHLYRVVQEAVTNAAKHGRADRIWIDLELENNRCALRITDNGVGIHVTNIPVGIGLKIMEYRSRRIGGSLSIHSPEEGGTIVTCLFPTPEVIAEKVDI